MPTRPWSTPVAAFVGCAIVFAAMAVLVATGIADPIDAAIISGIRDPAVAGLLAPLRQVTDLGSTPVITAMAIVAIIVGVALRRPRIGVAAGVTIGLAALANSLIKWAAARQRPDLLDPVVAVTGYSFPSGHAASAMVAYGVLAILASGSELPAPARRAALVVAAAIVLLVGISRVWLGVHYPTDVVAGWAAGGMLVAVFAGVSRRAPTEPAA